MSITGRGRFNIVVTDEYGNIAPGATVEIRTETGLALTDLFTNRNGTGARANPLTADENGYAFAYAATGHYQIKLSVYGRERILRDVEIGITYSPPREPLTADRTYFVAATGGNNANNGLTTGTALATFANAVSRFNSIDPNGFVCKVKLMNGTHEQAGVYQVGQPLIDRSALVVEGNLGNPALVVARRTNAGAVFIATGGANVLYDGITTRNDAGGSSVFVTNQSQAELRNMRYGFGGTSAQVLAAGLSRVVLGAGTHQIIGDANAFASADAMSEVNAIGRAITLTGTPAFTTGFARASQGGLVRFTACTFTGAATGPRFFGAGNGVIFTAGAELPGNADGTLLTGAQQV